MLNFSVGCAIAPELVSSGIGAVATYFAQRSTNVTYAAECVSTMIIPDDNYIDRWTANEKKQLLGHVVFFQDNCPPN